MTSKRVRLTHGIIFFTLLLFFIPGFGPIAGKGPARAAMPEPSPDSAVFEHLEWRNIGPAIMGGRTTDVEGIPGNPDLVYVGTASGGVWKTTNGGVRWTPIFDHEKTVAVGGLAIDPRNPDVIWVGTGEGTARNTVSFGDGVYKSTDSGKTWQNVGLKDTEYISRIVINPLNTDVVYVAALGHIFGANEARGVFMTTDGGKTWQKVLYLDNEHSAADVDIDLSNPNILYATLWRFERKPWTFTSGDEKGGVFKSVDGGRTWKKLEKGLPKLLGRTGVKVAPSNPNVVYVITESKEGTLYRSDDRGENFHPVSKEARLLGRGPYYAQLRVDPTDENRLYAIAMGLYLSIDGGKTFRPIAMNVHGDHHSVWIDQKNPRRIWQGTDGGVYVSYDRGDTWEFVNNFPIGQFYHVFGDSRLPFYGVVGGLQDNGVWAGPSRTREPAGILNDDWRIVSFGDGFYAVSHADNPDLYLSESQGGGLVRTDFRTRDQQDVSPQPKRNDGGPVGELKYRFNWNSPLVLSPHDKNTVYFAGNVIFKSTDFGKTWEAISPDLTINDPSKLGEAGGPVWFENTTAEYYCTIIAVGESPAEPGVIWAGTDDGNLQVTTDGGKTWTNVVRNVPGAPPHAQVSSVEPSRTSGGVAYATFENHMFDDFHPYVYRTSDFGRSWTNITGNLPENDYIWAVREDPKNARLLYAATELGLYASFTGGNHWTKLHMKNLPTVPIRDLMVHPLANDILLATHGRSIWIFDDATPLQQLTPEILGEDAHLFDVRPALRYAVKFTRYGAGSKPFAGPNPPFGAEITYYLKEKPAEKTKTEIQVLDAAGKVIREMKEIPHEQGLNRATWDLRYDPAHLRREPTEEERAQQGIFRGAPEGPKVLPGTYTVKLLVGDRSWQTPVEVRMDPTDSVSAGDLEAQFDMGLKLRDMESTANDALRTLDSLKDQIEERQKTVHQLIPKAPEELTKTLADSLKQVEALIDSMARPRDIPGYSKGPKLADRINGLFFTSQGPDQAPTPYQKEFFSELQSELDGKMAEVRGFVEQKIPKLNESLQHDGVAPLMVGKVLGGS